MKINGAPALAYRLPELPARMLIGLSGGADSVALAYLLCSLRNERHLELTAVHVNHGLRGADADADEDFVRGLCEAWALPLLVYRADPPEHPGEDWARQVRYGFFREAVAKCGAQAVALAHHRDDQAETLLLHLLRGAGLTGLTGMAADGITLGVRVVRPLLTFSRQELRAMLTDAGISWREDESNSDRRYLRNAVRHELLPLMERLAPGASSRLAGTAALLREDNQALAAQAEAFLAEHAGQNWLCIVPLRRFPTGLQSRVLRLWWTRFGGENLPEHALSRQQTEALLALLDAPAGSKCNLPAGCHGQRGWTHLHLIGSIKSVVMEPVLPGETLHGVTLMVAEHVPHHGDGRRTQAVPRSLLEGCVIRTRQPGDWICPFGSGGRQSMQDYFVNRRVDGPFRDRVPLLCRGSEVLLAAGIGAGAIPPMQVADDLIWLRWEGPMPWARVTE